MRAWVALGLCACSGPPETPAEQDAGPIDGGADAGPGPIAVEPSAEPEAASPPALEPCPPGWRAVTDERLTTCDPWPAGGRETCDAASVHFPGEPGCARIGPACPDLPGAWSPELPGDRAIVYVDAEAPPGGDGTRGAPFATIGEATAIADPGTVVALGPGTYDEAVRVPADVALWGTCVAGTVLTASAPVVPDDAVVAVSRAGAELHSLTITGPHRGVYLTTALASVDLEDVLVTATELQGILSGGGTVTGRTVVVRETGARDGIFGRALDAEEGSHVDLARVVLEGSRDTGAFTSDAGTSVTLTDAAVRDVRGNELDGLLGRGLQAGLGAEAHLVRAVVERTRDAALLVSDQGTLVTLDDVVLRDTASEEPTGVFGHALDVLAGARVEARRSVFERSLEAGIYLAEDSHALLDDVVVRDTRGRDLDGAFGRGISLESASAEGHRVWVEGSHDIGVFAGLPGSTLTLEDLTVLGTRGQESDGTFGRGLSAQDGARVALTKALFEDNREIGVALQAVPAVFEDLVVRGTGPQESDGRFGRGLSAEQGASVEVRRAELEGNGEAGVVGAGEGTTLSFSDLDVHDTQGNRDTAGRGLSVQQGARTTLERGRFERNREVAMFAALAGSSIEGSDVVVLDTLARGCAEDWCAGFGAGIGVGSYSEASIVLTRFVVSRAALTCAQLARGGTMDLHDGEVSECPIGANVQTEGFDANRLSDRVVFRDNERNLDAAELPVPEP